MSDTTREDLVAEGLATCPEAQAFLRVGHSTLYRLMGCGELAYVQIGRSRRIPWRALRDLASRHLRGGGLADE
ncbi:MAG: helix-turn-helix domain-containing protein [Deltaproteobacteria bacterium]|nr:helix-turn-helix domain-containing protein [Deltaproteobacteria bacterium]